MIANNRYSTWTFADLTPENLSEPVSPCIAVCHMDADSGWCKGCLRSIGEIAAWGDLTAAQKHRVLAQLPSRAVTPSVGHPS
jgi:predicted Fe-S protein YdhL (DUF1289 family)